MGSLWYSVLKAVHISKKYLRVYMGVSPLAGKFTKAVFEPFSLRKFPKTFYPTPFGNFREIQRRRKKVVLAEFDPLPSWFLRQH
jgi:hypothetical protein